MSTGPSRLGRPWWPLAVLALAFAFAWPMQVNGWNQNAHFALVRALVVYGTPWIDRTRHEIGDLGTGDVSDFEGHTYAAKAPGLALASAPALLALEAVGARTTGDPTRPVWALHLWAVVLPAVALLLLTRALGERVEAGYGLAAAVTLGVGTLLLPFATLLFSHVLAAALGFAAFAVLWREREREPRLASVAAAGALAGLAVTAEYPLVFAGAILGLYAISRGDVLRRGLAYAGGVVAGVMPLLLFNLWAFGSPTHVAYEDYYATPGQEVKGIFGFGLPKLGTAADLLGSSMGLLTLTPVLAAGVAGALLLLRRRRAEALVILGVAGIYFAYNSSLRYASPFGGLGPPRYLFTILPFLAVPLAVAFRAFPLTTVALATVSAFQMAVMTATGALAAYDGEWLRRLADRNVVETASAVIGVTGWYSILPFFAAVLVASVSALVGTPRPRVTRRDLVLAPAALVSWGLVAYTAASPNGRSPSDAYVLTAVVLTGVLVAALALVAGAVPGLHRRPSAGRATGKQALRRAR